MSKIEAFWENATAEDVARVMAGETVEARFKSVDNDWPSASPREGFLVGWSSYDTLFQYIDNKGDHFRFCQVYDPPQWWLDKPDPGEGYRLLEKFPDEPKLGTDEFWNLRDKTWRRTATTDETQSDCVWYRRRIEPVEPVKSKPVLIRRRVVEIGDEMELPNGRVLMFNGEGFEVKQ
jgi:hypothetical protein